MNSSVILPNHSGTGFPSDSRPGKIRILIADDHPLYREGLTYVIGRNDDMVVIGEADNGQKLVELAHRLLPDVILSDLKMPVLNGIGAVREIRSSGINARCVLFSQYNQDRYIADAIAVGASGYLVKKASAAEIIEAVYAAYSFHQYFCRFASEKLKKLIANSIYNIQQGPSMPYFSEFEKKIISLVCQEKSSSMIGEILFRSARTI